MSAIPPSAHMSWQKSFGLAATGVVCSIGLALVASVVDTAAGPIWQATFLWSIGFSAIALTWRRNEQVPNLVFMTGVLTWGFVGYVENNPTLLGLLPGLVVPFVALTLGIGTARRLVLLATGLLTIIITGQVLGAPSWLSPVLAFTLTFISSLSIEPRSLRTVLFVGLVSALAISLIASLTTFPKVGLPTLLYTCLLGVTVAVILFARNWRLPAFYTLSD